MGRIVRVLLVVAIGLFLGIPHVDAGIGERVTEKVLSNGLKVILLESHKAPVATFQVWYRVGSRNEAWGKTGLSHMLEHMMFKGTKKIGAEEFSRIIQENGGNDNAATSYDFTFYFTTISSDRIDIPIRLEADRMRGLLLKEEDFRTERMVVMEERRLRTADNPKALVDEQIMATAFQIQPYHWPVIGWMEDIGAFTLSDLKAYRDAYYQPSNAVIVAVGDFRAEEMLAKIERAFGSIPGGKTPPPLNVVDEPQQGERRLVVRKEAQLPYLAMAFHVPNYKNPDSYVLEVISAILSDGKSARLYEKLVREKRLALSIDTDNSLLSVDPSLFSFEVNPLKNGSTHVVEKAVVEEIERLKTEPVTAEELEKAKNQAEASFVYNQDSLFYQAMVLGQNEIAGGWRKVDDYVPRIRAVTAEDVARVAKRYLVPENRTVGSLDPLPPKAGTAPEALAPSKAHPVVR